MGKSNQRTLEKEFQKALAIEYAKDYCIKNNLSIDKLHKQRFTLVCNACAFEQPMTIKTNDLIIDGDPKPQITLIIKHEDGQLKIEETQYTKEFLGKN